MIEFPTVYGCQHPQGSVVRSVTSPNRSGSPQCWVNLCQGWRDSENFLEHQDLALAFCPRKFVMRNFTMKHSIASKESLNWNGSREAIWQRAGRLRRPSQRRRIMKSRWNKDSWLIEAVRVGMSKSGNFQTRMRGLESESYSTRPRLSVWAPKASPVPPDSLGSMSTSIVNE